MKKIEELMQIGCACDSKHILNTCSKVVPTDLLERIEGGCSLEVLEEMCKDYNIYKYKTQITIHGIFPALSTKRVGGYVNLVQNKNLSVGVKYSAIDADKKSKLFGCVKAVSKDWGVVRNSTECYIYKMAVLTPENVDLFKQHASSINRDLFIGSLCVYTSRSLFGDYVVMRVDVQCFYERNLPALAEGLAQMPWSEIERIYKEKVEEQKRRRAEADARYEREVAEAEAEKIRRAPIIEAAKREFLKSQSEWERVEKVKIEAGDELARLVVDFDVKTDTAKCRFEFYKVVKSFGRTVVRPVKPDNSLGRGAVLSTFTGYKKTALKSIVSASNGVNNKVHTTPAETPANGVKNGSKTALTLQVIDYSEKAIALIGDSRQIKSELKRLGGRFNPRLKCGAGWVFSKTKLSEVERLIARYA